MLALTVSPNISAPRLHKAFKAGSLALSAAELKGSGGKVWLNPESHKKALKALRAGKGVRLMITQKEIGWPFKHISGEGLGGGSIFGKIWHGIKKAFKWAKDSGALSRLADAAVAPASAYISPQGAFAARGALKAVTGIGIDPSAPVKVRLSKEQSPLDGGALTIADMKKAGIEAFKYAKRTGLATKGVDAAEKFMLTKATDETHRDLIKSVRRGIRARWGVGMAPQTRRSMKGGSFRLTGTEPRGGSFRLG